MDYDHEEDEREELVKKNEEENVKEDTFPRAPNDSKSLFGEHSPMSEKKNGTPEWSRKKRRMRAR